jgi:hypothetical protein
MGFCGGSVFTGDLFHGFCLGRFGGRGWCRRQSVVDVVWYEILWPLTNLFRFAEFFFEYMMVSKSAEIYRFFVSGLPFSRRCWLFGGGLWAETYVSRFSFCRFPTNFWPAELFFGLWLTVHFWFKIGS